MLLPFGDFLQSNGNDMLSDPKESDTHESGHKGLEMTVF